MRYYRVRNHMDGDEKLAGLESIVSFRKVSALEPSENNDHLIIYFLSVIDCENTQIALRKPLQSKLGYSKGPNAA